MKQELRVLIIEDLPTDAELCEREIRKAIPQSVFRRVETQKDYLANLESFRPDIILSDYRLPNFDGMTALKLALERVPETPFLIITGSMNEETAVACMKAGAWDYTIKEHIKSLGAAVTAALERKQTRQEYQRAEEGRRNSEMLFRKLFEDHAAVKLIIDPNNGNIVDANAAAANFYGRSREHLKQMNIQDINTLPSERIKEEMEKARTEKRIHFEFRHRRADGSIRDVEVFSSKIEVGGKDFLHSIIHDITDRRQAEKALRESEGKYRSIFENAQEGIYRSTPEGRFVLANQAMARILGYESPEELISSMSDIGRQIYVDPEERIRTMKLLEKQPTVHSREVQFYKKDGSVVWVSRNMHTVCDDNGKLLFYEGIVTDITERKASVERLHRALGATVRAIATTVELRDPYTAGHQRRVADLARSIATGMRLDPDRIEGLRLAAIVHDLGKVSIPAEILSKPSKLSEIELALIKGHPQTGCEILKEVESSWPLAEIVCQHHERMDGSGYPRGLKGDEILMEARIMAVADVVESMASHRPYRPALGVDAALDELEKYKGVHYDADVVDACLTLFREKGYTLRA